MFWIGSYSFESAQHGYPALFLYILNNLLAIGGLIQVKLGARWNLMLTLIILLAFQIILWII